MTLNFVIKTGKYGTRYLLLNGFQIGHLSWTLKREDPLPNCAHISFCGRSFEKQFASDEEGFEWMKAGAAKLAAKLAGIEEGDGR